MTRDPIAIAIAVAASATSHTMRASIVTVLSVLGLVTTVVGSMSCSSSDDSAPPRYTKDVDHWSCDGLTDCSCTGRAAGESAPSTVQSCPITDCCRVGYDADRTGWDCWCVPDEEECPSYEKYGDYRVSSCPPP